MDIRSDEEGKLGMETTAKREGGEGGRMRFLSVDALEAFRSELVGKGSGGRRQVLICLGTGCKACGGDEVYTGLTEAVKESGLAGEVEVVMTGCHGFCERGALMVVKPEGIFYEHVKPKDIPEIVEKTLKGGEVVERLLYALPKLGKGGKVRRGETIELEEAIPFYKNQERLVLGLNGKIDPTKIDEYIVEGGYGALGKVLSGMEPEEVVDEIIKSGLRGRGGGGFPTGLKWKAVREAAGEPKYVICNADEGDPGAFMDRSLLEGNPHSVIEGMIIGSYAIGSHEGYIYVRHEYPLAIERLEIALKQCEEYGFLGDDILGSGHSLRIRINRGGGAFVCGESSALMASIEGFVGEPRAKHIHMSEQGLYGKPTNLNNVETWANVPLILNKGSSWYTEIGTGDVSESPWGGSKGTKIFSLVGKVNNTGLVEVPMGMSIRDLVEKVGGGVKGKGKLKAVQTGGPSGGCIPENLCDIPVDFDKLTEVGSMMGSGGLIVMDDRTCMVDVARYFTGFLMGESCGKCSTCREGLRQLYSILERITGGEGREEDLGTLEELAETVHEASLCALGQTAANPLLSTLKYFREEYEAHIREKRCPGKTCKALIEFHIDEDKCTGCMVCKKCPVGAISGEKKEVHKIDAEKCVRCGFCFDVCRFDAVIVE